MADDSSTLEVDEDFEIPEDIPPVSIGIIVMSAIMLVVGWAWCWLADIQLLPPTSDTMSRDLGLAALAAVATVAVVVAAWRWTSIFTAIEIHLAERLGRLSLPLILVLAAFSSVAEEVFFRGAVQTTLIRVTGLTWLGYLITSFGFGWLHAENTRAFWPWTVFAMASGLILGGGFLLTGNILVPIVIHFVVNSVNMWLVVGRRGSAAK